MRPERVAGSSPARCRFHTSRSVLVTPASAARMNSTACAFGKQVERELGLGADRVQSRRVEDHEPLLQQRMREVDDRMPPARDVDRAFALGFERGEEILVLVEAVLARERDRHALHLRHARQRFAHAVGVRQVERNRHPLVGVVLELGDRRVLQPRLDRQQADRRRARRVVEELGRAHRRAARRRRQQPLAEIGEEDRVDELGLAARELGDERDDELVLVQPLEQLLDLEVDLGVGQILLARAIRAARKCRRTAAAASRCRPRIARRARATGRGHAVAAGLRHRSGGSAAANAGCEFSTAIASISRAESVASVRDRAPIGVSALAAGAIRGRAAPLADRFYCGAANPARQPFAPIDEVVELEIARLAAAVRRNREASTRLWRSRRRAFPGPRRAAARSAAATGGPRGDRRPDAGAEQRFVRVDVAHAGDEAVVHQRELDGRLPPPRRRPQIARIARRVERFGAERGEQRDARRQAAAATAVRRTAADRGSGA